MWKLFRTHTWPKRKPSNLNLYKTSHFPQLVRRPVVHSITIALKSDFLKELSPRWTHFSGSHLPTFHQDTRTNNHKMLRPSCTLPWALGDPIERWPWSTCVVAFHMASLTPSYTGSFQASYTQASSFSLLQMPSPTYPSANSYPSFKIHSIVIRPGGPLCAPKQRQLSFPLGTHTPI